jgi:hypothetical protein
MRNRIPTINAEKDANAVQAVRLTTMGINTRAKLAMAEPKSGRVYGRHQASAPGEAPAIDTGLLINSLQEAYENDGMTGYAFTNTAYAPDLEYGHTDGTVAPRPFMQPSAREERPLFVRRMKGIF